MCVGTKKHECEQEFVESKVDDAFLEVFLLACATYKERPDTQVLVFRCSAKLAITLVILLRCSLLQVLIAFDRPCLPWIGGHRVSDTADGQKAGGRALDSVWSVLSHEVSALDLI